MNFLKPGIFLRVVLHLGDLNRDFSYFPLILGEPLPWIVNLAAQCLIVSMIISLDCPYFNGFHAPKRVAKITLSIFQEKIALVLNLKLEFVHCYFLPWAIQDVFGRLNPFTDIFKDSCIFKDS